MNSLFCGINKYLKQSLEDIEVCSSTIQNSTKSARESPITLVSISRSRRSLTVHPAPRKSKAPQPNSVIIFKSGRLPGGAAKAIDLHIVP